MPATFTAVSAALSNFADGVLLAVSVYLTVKNHRMDKEE